MAHQHHHHSEEKNIRIAFFLNLTFTFIEIVGGIFTNSVAILSDAIHDLGDTISLALAWYFQKVSKRESNSSFTYGYKRFSLLGAIINSVVLVVGSIFILSAAIPRVFHPEKAYAEGMFFLAIVGILVNGLAVLKLKKGASINEKVVSLHMLEDVLGWAAIFIGSILMHFFDLPILDPIMSIGIACFVLFNVYKNIKETLHIILQGSPDEQNQEQIKQKIMELGDINDIHDLHIWSIDGNYNVLTIHVVLNRPISLEDLTPKKEAIRAILEKVGIQHVTIEFESPAENCCYTHKCN